MHFQDSRDISETNLPLSKDLEEGEEIEEGEEDKDSLDSHAVKHAQSVEAPQERVERVAGECNQ